MFSGGARIPRGGAATVADPGPGWGGEKHEFYVATFGSHLFYDLFSQGWGPLDPLLRQLPGKGMSMLLFCNFLPKNA